MAPFPYISRLIILKKPRWLKTVWEAGAALVITGESENTYSAELNWSQLKEQYSTYSAEGRIVPRYQCKVHVFNSVSHSAFPFSFSLQNSLSSIPLFAGDVVKRLSGKKDTNTLFRTFFSRVVHSGAMCIMQISCRHQNLMFSIPYFHI